MKDLPYKREETPEDTRGARSDPREPFQQEPDSDIGESVEGRRGSSASTYFPPTDPVEEPDERGSAEIVGGFSSDSMDAPVAESVTRGPGDEAIADAVRRELREDASTNPLEIEVDVTNGVVRLTGQVADLTDAENAEAVAGRVSGVTEVVDALDVPGLRSPRR